MRPERMLTRQAFEYTETGHPRGKVVISIKE